MPTQRTVAGAKTSPRQKAADGARSSMERARRRGRDKSQAFPAGGAVEQLTRQIPPTYHQDHSEISSCADWRESAGVTPDFLSRPEEYDHIYWSARSISYSMTPAIPHQG